MRKNASRVLATFSVASNYCSGSLCEYKPFLRGFFCDDHKLKQAELSRATLEISS